jgi:Domain of unknown function (DUF4412)
VFHLFANFVAQNQINLPMKKIITAALLLLVMQAQSQTFEGTIKWSMKMEITDPKLKAQMEQAQQKAKDPAQQAKMKEMQDKMNDPKMKAMLDANPQMKAQMESMMKMTQSGDMMSNMMPKSMIMKMKGTSSLVSMDGGMMHGDFLYTTEKSVLINRSSKTYSVMPTSTATADEKASQPKMQHSVSKTSETMKVMGYTCTKYVVTTTSGQGHTTTTNLWTTTEIKDIDLKSLAKQRHNQGQSMYYEGVEGIPLRIESGTPQGQMIMEVTEIKRESLNASVFTIPSDYKETQGMFGR